MNHEPEVLHDHDLRARTQAVPEAVAQHEREVRERLAAEPRAVPRPEIREDRHARVEVDDLVQSRSTADAKVPEVLRDVRVRVARGAAIAEQSAVVNERDARDARGPADG